MKYSIFLFLLLIIGCDKDVELINQKSPVKLTEKALINQQREVIEIQFAANPDKIFFLSRDTNNNQKLINKFDILSKSLIFEIEDEFIDFSCNHNNDWMIAAKPDELLLLEQPNGKLAGQLPLGDSIDQIAFSNDIRYSAYTNQQSENIITIYDNINGRELYKFNHSCFIDEDRIMLFSPANQYFVAAGRRSASASIWELSNGSAMPEIIHTDKTDGIINIVFSQDGKKISTASANKIIVKNWLNNDVICEFETGYIPVNIHFIFDDRFLIAGFSRSINIYDIEKEQLIFSQPIEYLTDFAVAPDDKKLISVQNNGTMKIWRIQSNIFNYHYAIYHNKKL